MNQFHRAVSLSSAIVADVLLHPKMHCDEEAVLLRDMVDEFVVDIE